jgi:hypothetical protein
VIKVRTCLSSPALEESAAALPSYLAVDCLNLQGVGGIRSWVRFVCDARLCVGIKALEALTASSDSHISTLQALKEAACELQSAPDACLGVETCKCVDPFIVNSRSQ